MSTRERNHDKLLRDAKLLAVGVDPPLESAQDAQEYLDTVEQAEREERTAQQLEAEQGRDDALATRGRAPGDRARDVAAIRRKLQASAEGHEARAASAVKGREGERLPDADYDGFRRAVNAVVREADLDAKLGRLESEFRAKVTREPGPYDDASSPHSWVRDVLVSREPELRSFMSARSAGSNMAAEAVEGRLRQHSLDVARAVQKRDAYGKRVAATLRESRRQEDKDLHRKLAEEELRAMTAGGGATASATSGASVFVSPAFLLEQWAAYRSPYKAFADQCAPGTLPAYGLECYIPIVTTGSSVTSQVEGEAVAEEAPVTGFTSSAVVTKAGQIAVTQQYLDRAGSPGIEGDAILFAQIKDQLSAQVDTYALSQALAGAQSVTNTGAFTVTTASGVGGFLKDLKSAKNKLHDTAGTRVRGTQCFAIGDVVDFVSSFADAQGRPLFSPTLDDNRLPIRSTGDATAEGFSGYVLVGLALFADDNIPEHGTGGWTQVIVTRPEAIVLLQGEPVPYVFPPSLAGSLEAVLGVRSYVAVVPRWPSGVASISGSAYLASAFA